MSYRNDYRGSSANGDALFLACRYTSPRSQLTIASILTLVEIAFDVVWLLKEPPAVTSSYPSREANIRICRGSENGSYVIGLAYPFLLTSKLLRYSREL